MNSVQDVWNAVYQKISDAYTPTAANTWFAGAQPLAMNSKCFKLQVPSDFQKEIIINRFGDKLTAFLTELVGFSLEVVIYSEEEQEQRKRIAERIVDVDDITSHSLSQDDYTFENFIVGGSNKLAEAACRAVANHTEDSFNPLFIYGGSGIGKTHLPMLLTALAMGADGVRVGLEDNLYLSRGVKATNVQLVERAAAIAKLCGREIATAEEARAIWGIKRHALAEYTPA